MSTAEQPFLAEVFVTLKPAVNDPEGLEIRHGLHILGYEEVEVVRSGKYIQLQVRAASPAAAEVRVREMSDRLLSNPVIEQFRVQVTPLISEG